MSSSSNVLGTNLSAIREEKGPWVLFIKSKIWGKSVKEFFLNNKNFLIKTPQKIVSQSEDTVIFFSVIFASFVANYTHRASLIENEKESTNEFRLIESAESKQNS